jgi:small subunit ribosomal protein S21
VVCDEVSNRVFFCLWRKAENEKSARRSGKSEMTVELKPGESQESLLRRFRKRVSESGVLSQVRKRRRYVSKSEERRRAKAKAIRRARRRERQRKQRK